MKCPNCQQNLELQNYKGIEVNQCSNCSGMWFDYKEVDQLEDTSFDQDDLKNTLVTKVKPSDKECPVCSKKMNKFNYRWEELELETCPDKHGFWLDKGEEEKVPQLIEEYEENLEEKNKTEMEWTNHLKRLQSPSLFNKLVEIFG